MLELSTRFPLHDWLDEECTMACRQGMYMIGATDFAALMGIVRQGRSKEALASELEEPFTPVDHGSETPARQRGRKWAYARTAATLFACMFPSHLPTGTRHLEPQTPTHEGPHPKNEKK